jgi:hypothetical protein
MERYRMVALMALVLATEPGCVGVRSKSERVSKAWPPDLQAIVQPLTLRVAVKHFVNGKEEDGFPYLAEEAKKTAFETYDSSKLFESVFPDAAPGAIIAEVLLENSEESNNALLFLFVFFSTLIPAYVDNDLTVTTMFKNEDGKVLATIKKTAQMTTWMEFFLLFGMPFAHPSPTMRKLQADLHRETIYEAIALGVLSSNS